MEFPLKSQGIIDGRRAEASCPVSAMAGRTAAWSGLAGIGIVLATGRIVAIPAGVAPCGLKKLGPPAPYAGGAKSSTHVGDTAPLARVGRW